VIEKGSELAVESGLIAKPSNITPQALGIMTAIYEGNLI